MKKNELRVALAALMKSPLAPLMPLVIAKVVDGVVYIRIKDAQKVTP